MKSIIIFDMDGTIADTEPLHKIARDNLLISLGLSPEELSDKAIGRGKREYWAEVAKDNNLDISADHLTVKEFKELLEIFKQKQLKPQDGLVELLEWLQAKGIQIAVASSSDRFYILETLKILGIENYFSVIATADDVGIAKPAPDVYQKALKDLGVSNEQAIAVEDSTTGAKSAVNAKIRCIGFASEVALVSQDFSICYRVITKMQQIKDVLE